MLKRAAFQRQRVSRQWIVKGAIALVALGLSIALVVAVNPGSRPMRTFESLVVVPLANATGSHELGYLAQGIGEAVTDRLSAVAGLRVISPRRARRLTGLETTQDLVRDLGVDAVLRGSVNTAGPWLQVKVELVEGESGSILMTRSFNRDLEQALELEAEVAAAVAEIVRERREFTTPVNNRVDPDAYRAYLRGRFYRHRGEPEDLSRAVGYLEQAIDLDPSFAEAHAALAEVWLLRVDEPGTVLRTAWEQSSASASTALRLDPQLSAAHAADAMVKFFLEWDFTGAGSGFERALERHPNEPVSMELYARFLTISGRFDEAIEHYRILQEMEPGGEARTGTVQVLLYAHRFDEARDLLQELMLDCPEDPDVRLLLGLLYELQGRESEAVAAYISAMQRFEMSGKEIAAMTELSEQEGFQGLFSILAENARSPVQKAAWHARLGEREQAIEWLEEGLRTRDQALPWIAVHPAFESLRDEPRYHRLLDVLGLVRPRIGGQAHGEEAPAAENPLIFSYR